MYGVLIHTNSMNNSNTYIKPILFTWYTFIFHLFIVGLVGPTVPPIHLETGTGLFTLTIAMDNTGHSTVSDCAVSGFISTHPWTLIPR